MNDFNKLNETFNMDAEPTPSKWPPWYFFKFLLILLWSIVIIYWSHDGIQYVAEHGLKPSIKRFIEGSDGR